MEQSKLSSLIESLINILIGYGVALLSQLAIFPMVGIHIPLSTNMEIGAYFTLVSLVRSYVIRRWFNKMIRDSAKRLAGSEKLASNAHCCFRCSGKGWVLMLDQCYRTKQIEFKRTDCPSCSGSGLAESAQ